MALCLEHIAAIPTPRPCNCLLASASFSSRISKDYILEYACYELNAKTAETEEVGHAENNRKDAEAPSSGEEEKSPQAGSTQRNPGLTYRGASSHLVIHANTLQGETRDVTRDTMEPAVGSSLPFGVFDQTWIARTAIAPSLRNPCEDEASWMLLTACTDGAVRLLHPHTHSVIETFPSVHTEMLTSCTPFVSSSGSSSELRLWCTAHGGEVVVYNVAERCVERSFEGHQFDAWCGAVWPSGVGTSPSLSSSSINPSGEVGEGSLLLSGGDDGLLKFYDLRCGMTSAVVGKMRFEAGVVSISPVLQSSPGGVGFLNETNSFGNFFEVLTGTTPYLLVGSYDESLSLVDLRYRKRPVASRGEMEGGVWRTSRCLIPVRAAASAGRNAGRIGETSGDETTLPPARRTPRSNFELFEQNTLPFHVVDRMDLDGGSGKSAGRTRIPVATQSCVTQKNILILPLMQRGAAFLSYDVSKAENEVFAPPQYFFPSPSSTGEGGEDDAVGRSGYGNVEHDHSANPRCLLQESITQECLVYDTAVLGLEIPPCRSSAEEEGESGGKKDFINDSLMVTATVATCSFYEKKIDLWRANIKLGCDGA
ncbi:unnamed protein product [Phytomonas sp. EM1]|nr:unnamed protein product [Phytomonas sp. EM1]|eukprot:CCW62868.1 unnamed protein product [Phytomonas sp. isolate EM1]